MKIYYGSGFISGSIISIFFIMSGIFAFYVQTFEFSWFGFAFSAYLFLSGIYIFREFIFWYRMVPQDQLQIFDLKIIFGDVIESEFDVVSVKCARKTVHKSVNGRFSGSDYSAVVEILFRSGRLIRIRGGTGPASFTMNFFTRHVGVDDVHHLLRKMNSICAVSQIKPEFVEYRRLVR